MDRPSAEQAAARLSRLGFASRSRPAREEIRVGQWVRLENLATPEDAANALGVMRSAGIADAYVIAEEGTGTIISLGVFADEARARQAVTIARMSGFEPQVVERLRPADVFWLDIDRLANAGLPALEDLQGRVRPVRRHSSCDLVHSPSPRRRTRFGRPERDGAAAVRIGRIALA